MKNSRTLISERQDRLLQYLKEHQSASVSEISEVFNVSLATVRRDLDCLESKGLADRFFGGVRLYSHQANEKTTPSEFKSDKLQEVRGAIAKTASTFIEEGDTIFINSSSTAMLLLEHLKDKRVTVITNNGRALYMSRDSKVELVLTGGEVYGNKQSLVGQFAVQSINCVRSTKSVLGVSGISVAGGITSAVVQETSVNQAMLCNCVGQKIIVADGSKVGTVRNFVSGSVRDITHLITDQSAPKSEIEKLREAGVEVIVVTAANQSN